MLRWVVGGATHPRPRWVPEGLTALTHSELRPSEQMSFSTVKNIRPVGRRMCSATHRGRGCSKFQTAAAKAARRPGILAPDNPPPTRLPKKEKGVRNHVPHSFLREGPPRFQKVHRNPLWDTTYNPSICPVARFSSRRHNLGILDSPAAPGGSVGLMGRSSGNDLLVAASRHGEPLILTTEKRRVLALPPARPRD